VLCACCCCCNADLQQQGGLQLQVLRQQAVSGAHVAAGVCIWSDPQTVNTVLQQQLACPLKRQLLQVVMWSFIF
jgi:hypothetical protein